MADRKIAHHHGNLREALVLAGLQLVREGGPEALTIRGAAAKAGVSHAAPKHHFPTLMHLRTAVATKAFSDFTQAMETAIAQAPPADGRASMIAICTGYLRFARSNPGLFQIMFGMDGIDHEDRAFKEAAQASYSVLARIAAVLRPGEAGSQGNEILLWSIAHGFSSLALLGEFGDARPEEIEHFLGQIFPDLPMVGDEPKP